MRALRSASRRRQAGLAAVEFALIGAAFFVVLFGVIEVGRAMFARAVLEESVRRAARVAVVCPVNDPAIVAAATFTEGGGDALLPGFTAANVRLQYLSATGGVVGNPAVDFAAIRFVRVAIQNYQLPLFIPFLDLVLTPANVSSTLPAESLGVSRTAVTPC